MNHEGHRPECREAQLIRFSEDAPVGIGWTREDEDGWFQVAAFSDFGDELGYWVIDKYGEEHFIAADKIGDGWRAPAGQGETPQ